jgi:hypothetical protein
VNTLVRPDVILTHESDLDGFVSGLLLQRLAKSLFNADIPLEAFHYNSWRLREPREKAGWICDLGFEPRLDKLNWTIIDHHATDVQPKNARLIHNLDKSAGLLCYELCKENGLGSPALDRLVHLNDVADLFLEDDPDFVLANDYANLVKTYQFWNLKHENIWGQNMKTFGVTSKHSTFLLSSANTVESAVGALPVKKTLVRLSQAENASSSMVVTLPGIVTLVRLVQSWNAPSPMVVTPLPIVTFVRLRHALNASYPIFVMSPEIVTLPRLLQLANAKLPMPVPLPEIVTLPRLVQFSNAPSPMVVRPSSIATLVRALKVKEPPTTPLVNRDSATRRARRLEVQFDVGELLLR